jgi:hypothetical protein
MGAFASGSLLSSPAPASKGFDPSAPCAALFAGDRGPDDTLAATWALGYLAAKDDALDAISLMDVVNMVGKLKSACEADPATTLLTIVSDDQPAVGLPAGNAAQARAMLEKFLDPQADHAALTAELIPNEADIRAVYKDPLAASLVARLLPRFQPGAVFRPKPGQDALLFIYTTTDALIARAPVLDEFPGGYGEVLDYMTPGLPIARFKFVKSGETSGLAFDGLIFVNDRWVLIPKPWRYLK